MRYRWGKKEIVAARNKVMRLMDVEENPRQKAYYGEVVDTLNSYLFYKYDTFDVAEPPLKNMIANATGSFLSSSRYVSLINDFHHEISPMYDEIDCLSDRKAQLEEDRSDLFKSKRFTHDETFSLVKAFYEGFDPELYRIFSKNFDKKFALKFIKHDSRQIREGIETSAYCFFVAGVNKNFISVDERPGLIKVSDAVHEFGHGIKNIISPESAYNEEKGFINEVESMFPEYVFLQEMGHGINPLESAIIPFDGFITYYGMASDIVLQQKIINAWRENGFVINKNMYNKLKESFKITKRDVRDSLLTNIENGGSYIVSFGIVLELLNIYKRDREKAIYLYKKFIKAPSNEDAMTTLLRMQHEIPIFDHLVEECQNITSSLSNELTLRMSLK